MCLHWFTFTTHIQWKTKRKANGASASSLLHQNGFSLQLNELKLFRFLQFSDGIFNSSATALLNKQMSSSDFFISANNMFSFLVVQYIVIVKASIAINFVVSSSLTLIITVDVRHNRIWVLFNVTFFCKTINIFVLTLHGIFHRSDSFLFDFNDSWTFQKAIKTIVGNMYRQIVRLGSKVKKFDCNFRVGYHSTGGIPALTKVNVFFCTHNYPILIIHFSVLNYKRIDMQ